MCIAVGPALTLLAMMVTTPATANPLPACIAALLLGTQLVGLISAALITFPGAFHGCDYTGPGAYFTDGAPACMDSADLDFGRLFLLAIPSVSTLLLVCTGVWFGRNWALWAGIVWQASLALALVALGATLPIETSQNYWYEWFPLWTSPRYLADALLVVVIPTLATLFAARPLQLRGAELRAGARPARINR